MNCVICKEPIGPGQSYYTIGPKHFSCVIARAKDEDLLSVIRDGVAMLEATWGDTEKRCAEMKATGNVDTLPDGTESYGQPWDWLRRAKGAL